MMLQEYTNNGFKVLVSNDYDEIIKEIIHYFDGVRINVIYVLTYLSHTKHYKIIKNSFIKNKYSFKDPDLDH